MKICIINGPNLNMLGKREPNIYGNTTLLDIEKKLKKLSKKLKIELDFFQSNYEGAIIDYLHKIADKYDGIIINPAALTHTSIALRDALLFINIPTIEVHISNIYKREKFRQKSMIADIAIGQITGIGIQGYEMALRAFRDL